MRAMKDSGVEWIGEIPDEWQVCRMKFCIKSRVGGSWGEDATQGEGDCICMRIADFDYARFRFKDAPEYTIRHYDNALISRLKLEHGDILIEKSGGGEKTPVGRTVIFDKKFTAVYANFMDRLRCSDLICPELMQYIFVTFYANGYAKNYIKQTTGIQNLDLTSMLSQESVPIPPLAEQQRIAAYLDDQCGEIDKVLAKTRESIEEYKKLKQSVITEAVTKGIRPDRPMKPSGIEWIGEMPKLWAQVPVKKLAIFINGFAFSSDWLSPEASYPVIRIGDIGDNGSIDFAHALGVAVADNLTGFTIKKNDILIAMSGATTGKVGFVKNNPPTSFINQRVGIIRSDKYNKYLFYCLSTNVFKEYVSLLAAGSAQPNLSTEGIKNYKVMCPPENELDKIIKYLDQQCAEIDRLIAKKEQIITELESYKKSLIYECVTGKREVE